MAKEVMLIGADGLGFYDVKLRNKIKGGIK